MKRRLDRTALDSRGAKRKLGAPIRHKRSAALEDTIHVQAATYCVLHFPTLWTVGGLREENRAGKRRWRITVVLRYPTGHEGELGELLFDGKRFRLVTPRSVMEERAKKIAADPALQQEWNEHRDSSLATRNA